MCPVCLSLYIVGVCHCKSVQSVVEPIRSLFRAQSLVLHMYIGES